MVLISYYLLLQWPPKIDSIETQVQISESEENRPYLGSTESISIENEVLSDSKDTLTPLVDRTDTLDINRTGPLENLYTKEVFYIENDVLKIGIQAQTGRFIISEMKK